MTLEDPLWTLSRVLQDSNATAEEEEEEFDDSAVLRNTFLVYGSVLVVVFLLFCHLRLKYKNVYNLRSYVPDLKSPLAEDSYGFFSWFYHMFYVHSDEFLVHCGLDALCYVRILQMGYKICLVGVFSSLFLFPIYSTADGEASNKVVELTTAHLPATSKRFIATVVAAYIVFGYTLYLILQELTWFREQRYKFLQLPQPRNYACYIQHALVGDTNAAVARMIRESIGTSHEVSAHLRRLTPELDQWVKERDVCVGKLEHAIAEHEQTGTRPTHTEKNLTETLTGASAKPLDSIDTYSQQLLELNRKISQRIGELEVERETEATMNAIDADNVALEGETVTDRVDDLQGNKDENTGLLPKRLQRIASKAVALVGSGPADGQYINSGFLVFETLRDKQSALQLIHFGWPYMCQVFEAPDPDDSTYLGGCVRGLVVVSLFLTFVLVNWSNVGKTHHQITVGKHISLAATAALCLLWTIPMSFIASLSSVAALRAEFDFIDSALDAAPFLEPVLEIVAPLFVVIVNGLLPVILTTFTLFEGPISGAVTEASLFTKLSAFMIIQTFFVSAVSGSILQELAKIIDQPTKAIDLLADSLPTQSTYFLQIAFVTTSVTAAMEILRIVPIVLAWLRGCIGPKLTEKERNTTFVGLRPLSDPAEFCFADWTSQLVLFFVILFVYSVIAPIINYVLGFCFLYLGAVYRHQFVYVYPSRPDSGGRLWINFIGVMLTCLLIAEFTIVGMLALKKSAIATTLMIPLLVGTILFSNYIKQEHFRVTNYLPTRDCVKKDEKNGEHFDLSFVKGAYVQPTMQNKVILPEVSDEKATELGLKLEDLENRITPPPSTRGQPMEEVEVALDDDKKGGIMGVMSNLFGSNKGHSDDAPMSPLTQSDVNTTVDGAMTPDRSEA